MKSYKKVKDAIRSDGNTIGSVYFYKKSDGSLRKMNYRLHVRTPSVAPIPTGKGDKYGHGWKIRKVREDKQNVMTVLDVNKVVRDNKGKIIGRGAWRTIPLENVVRVKTYNKTHEFSLT